MGLFRDLSDRGLIHGVTEGAEEHLTKGPVTAYIGFDPTADSLHVGSLLQILGLARLRRHGHQPIALVGSGTGMIGDPSGKAKERTLLGPDEIARNVAGIRTQIETILARDEGARSAPARVVDNGEWLGRLSAVELLRDVGKHFTVNAMLAKESVRRRVDSEQGISFTEFAYMILQAYDFLVLNERFGCSLQMGGSDQWGNITAGIDLVRAKTGRRAFGITGPLVTSSSGAKFGKTESGAIWLDPARTSPYRFYQFWMNVEDADVARYLRFFTFLEPAEIAAIEAEHANDPGARAGHRRLAEEVTRLVHDATAVDRAKRATEVFFGGAMKDLAVADVLEVFEDVPSSALPRERFAGAGLPIVDLLAESGLATSKKDARRAVESGGAYVNNVRVPGPDARVTLDQSVGGALYVLRKGKRSYHVVRLTDGASA